MGGDETLQNCGVLHIDYQVREKAITQEREREIERERDSAVKVLEDKSINRQT